MGWVGDGTSEGLCFIHAQSSGWYSDDGTWKVSSGN